METRIFVTDHNPATATSKLIGENTWLELTQGGNVMAICLPARMDAAARMIVEAFNSHLMGGPITRAAQGEKPFVYPDRQNPGFPSGGAMTGEAAFAIVASWLAQEVADDMVKGREGDGDHAVMDDVAAHAVERRDLP